MEIAYSEHAQRRLRERGLTELQVKYVLTHPISVRNAHGALMATAELNGRKIKVVFVRTESYIKIVTVM